MGGGNASNSSKISSKYRVKINIKNIKWKDQGWFFYFYFSILAFLQWLLIVHRRSTISRLSLRRFPKLLLLRMESRWHRRCRDSPTAFRQWMVAFPALHRPRSWASITVSTSTPFWRRFSHPAARATSFHPASSPASRRPPLPLHRQPLTSSTPFPWWLLHKCCRYKIHFSTLAQPISLTYKKNLENLRNKKFPSHDFQPIIKKTKRLSEHEPPNDRWQQTLLARQFPMKLVDDSSHFIIR